MIKLQTAISNLRSTSFSEDKNVTINLKFGPLNVNIPLFQGNGGKCLYLDIDIKQMVQIYEQYACCLLFQNNHGKFFSVLSLKNIKQGQKIICQEINFFNDLRQVKYKCQFSIYTIHHQQIKVPIKNKFAQTQNILQNMKKPPIPIQRKVAVPSKTTSSFLYGKNNYANNLNQQRYYKNTVIQNKIKTQNKIQNINSINTQYYQRPQQIENIKNIDNIFQESPPIMEFTNDSFQDIPVTLQVPQISHLQYQSIQKQQQNPKKINNYVKQKQYEKVQKINKKQVKINKQQIKKLAKQQIQNIQLPQNIMLPIVKGEKYQLVPLSNLKPEQIINYVKRQKQIEQKQLLNQRKKKQLQERQQQLREKNKKLQLMIQQKQRYLDLKNNQQIRKTNKQSIRNSQIKQQEDDQDQNYDYQSDFQSMSLTGSAIKSRLSSKGQRKRASKQQQSIIEDEYPQQFESYSQSKSIINKNKAHSYSDYSQSYRSISQSFRK